MTRAASLAAILMIGLIGPLDAQTYQTAPIPPPSAPPSSGVVIERQVEETTAFRNAACRDRPNGYYCGTGTNRQLMYQCVNGQISNELSCPGGCNPTTMSCAQEFGVKGIDPPKPN